MSHALTKQGGHRLISIFGSIVHERVIASPPLMWFVIILIIESAIKIDNIAKSIDSLRVLIGDIVQNKRQTNECRKPGPKRHPGCPDNRDKSGQLSDGSRSQ